MASIRNRISLSNRVFFESKKKNKIKTLELTRLIFVSKRLLALFVFYTHAQETFTIFFRFNNFDNEFTS